MRSYAEVLEFATDDLVMVEQELETQRERFDKFANSSGPFAHQARLDEEHFQKIIGETDFDLRQGSGDDVALEALAAVTERVRNLVPWLVNRRLMAMGDAGDERVTRQ